MDFAERNCSKALVSRQYGYFLKWKDYDPMFYRYRVQPPYMHRPTYESPVFACKTVQKEGREQFVAMANEDGHLVLMNTENEERVCTAAHNNAIFDLAWRFNQMQLVTASGDHTSKLFDLEEGGFREVRMFTDHHRSVRTVAFRKDDPSVFVTGSRDGNIILWDIRCAQNSFIGKPDCTIYNSHVAKDIHTPSKSKKKAMQMSNSGVKSVTGLVFQNSNSLISCGAGDGIIKIWDLRKHYTVQKRKSLPKHVIPFSGASAKNGYSSLTIDSSGVRLYANCLDNTIYCYNVATYDTCPVMKYTGHQNDSFYVKSSLNEEDTYLISGSSDESAYLWNLNYSEPIIKLTGHTSEVTCVAWCKSKLLPSLITCSDDMSFKIWTMGGSDDSDADKSLGSVEVLPLPTQKPSRKRIYTTGSFDIVPKRLAWQCKNCQKATIAESLCENCVPNGLKRRADCDLWSDSKRIGTEIGPRRLFAHLDGNFKEGDTPDQFIEMLVRPEDDSMNLKSLNKALEVYKSSSTSSLLASPTLNLPNYVVDGTAPHLNYSPPKRKSQDWLTKLRIEHHLRQEMVDRTMGPSSPKSPRLELTPRSSKSSSAPKSPLLRYFKVINNSGKSDTGFSCSPKNHNCGYVPTTSTSGHGVISDTD